MSEESSETFLERLQREQGEKAAERERKQKEADATAFIRYSDKDPADVHSSVEEQLRIAEGVNAGMTIEEAQDMAKQQGAKRVANSQMAETREKLKKVREDLAKSLEDSE